MYFKFVFCPKLCLPFLQLKQEKKIEILRRAQFFFFLFWNIKIIFKNGGKLIILFLDKYLCLKSKLCFIVYNYKWSIFFYFWHLNFAQNFVYRFFSTPKQLFLVNSLFLTLFCWISQKNKWYLRKKTFYIQVRSTFWHFVIVCLVFSYLLRSFQTLIITICCLE